MPSLFTVIEGLRFLKMPHVVLFCGFLRGSINPRNQNLELLADKRNVRVCHIGNLAHTRRVILAEHLKLETIMFEIYSAFKYCTSTV